jgi:pyruvate/2-oxoglutarate dehydrogenase complex dihydrolipoamide acyltransferase (E2) component
MSGDQQQLSSLWLCCAGGRVVASPYAKKLAADAGISLAGVGGSAPSGRIVAADVQQLIASGGAAPAAAAAAPGAAAAAPGGEYTDVPVTQIKRITADRLLMSKQTIPHYYLTMECQVRQQQCRAGASLISSGPMCMAPVAPAAPAAPVCV